MRIPGFTAEASVYRTSLRYYMGVGPVQASGAIYPAQQASCINRCRHCCITACRHDGNPLSFCQRLCYSDCEAYGPCWPASCSRQPPQPCGTCGPCNQREVYGPPGTPILVDYYRSCTNEYCQPYRRRCLVCDPCIAGTRWCYGVASDNYQEPNRREPC